ncbi:hypothetical protein ABIE35_002124 [Paenarthrobacter sp. 4246]
MVALYIIKNIDSCTAAQSLISLNSSPIESTDAKTDKVEVGLGITSATSTFFSKAVIAFSLFSFARR